MDIDAQVGSSRFRQLAVINVIGGALVIIGFGISAVALAPNLGAADVRKIPAADASVRNLVSVIQLAFAILLAIGIPVLASVARAGWAGVVGAVVLVCGYALMVVRIVATFAGTQSPFHPLLAPACFAVGALVFGVAVYRANVLSRSGALLLAFFKPTAMLGLFGPAATTLLFGTDLGLAPSTLLPLYGDVASFGVGAGYVLLGLSARALPAGAPAVATRPAHA